VEEVAGPGPEVVGPGAASPDTEAASDMVEEAPLEPAARRTSGSDRIFRGQRPSPPPSRPSSTPAVTHGPLPPPAPVPVPERIREAVSEPIGSSHPTEPVPTVLDDAGETASPSQAPDQRNQPLRASPKFRHDLIQPAGKGKRAEPADELTRNGGARGGTRATRRAPEPRESPEPPDPSGEEDAPSAMETLASLYPPPSTDSSASGKGRRRGLRRG
jgi:hypothetical protein